MSVQRTECPTCGAKVALCDNGVMLDIPSVPFSQDPDGACWRIMQLGGLDLAAANGPEQGQPRGHTLHEHQPEEPFLSDSAPSPSPSAGTAPRQGQAPLRGRKLRFKVMWRQLQEKGHQPYPDDPDGWPPYRRYMQMELGSFGVAIHLSDSSERDPAYVSRDDFTRLGVLDLDTGDLVDDPAQSRPDHAGPASATPEPEGSLPNRGWLEVPFDD